jgi:hypothetical protein
MTNGSDPSFLDLGKWRIGSVVRLVVACLGLGARHLRVVVTEVEDALSSGFDM